MEVILKRPQKEYLAFLSPYVPHWHRSYPATVVAPIFLLQLGGWQVEVGLFEELMKRAVIKEVYKLSVHADTLRRN
jgi:hypothetical protein